MRCIHSFSPRAAVLAWVPELPQSISLSQDAGQLTSVLHTTYLHHDVFYFLPCNLCAPRDTVKHNTAKEVTWI